MCFLILRLKYDRPLTVPVDLYSDCHFANAEKPHSPYGHSIEKNDCLEQLEGEEWGKGR